jgi:hypothetical protein
MLLQLMPGASLLPARCQVLQPSEQAHDRCSFPVLATSETDYYDSKQYNFIICCSFLMNEQYCRLVHKVQGMHYPLLNTLRLYCDKCGTPTKPIFVFD